MAKPKKHQRQEDVDLRRYLYGSVYGKIAMLDDPNYMDGSLRIEEPNPDAYVLRYTLNDGRGNHIPHKVFLLFNYERGMWYAYTNNWKQPVSATFDGMMNMLGLALTEPDSYIHD